MIDFILITGLILIVILIGGIISKCGNCGKWWSVKHFSHQGNRVLICKHCGDEKEI